MNEHRPGRPPDEPKRTRPAPACGVDEAFGIWLETKLHELYDDVVREPIPGDLLRLIEADRLGRSKKG